MLCSETTEHIVSNEQAVGRGGHLPIEEYRCINGDSDIRQLISPIERM
jgi:hypothetical protein